MKTLTLLLGTFWLAGCSMTPTGVTPVQNFDLERYLGTWYEIARLDHHFEKGLSQVSATYSKRKDGGIDVLNRGLKSQSGEWKEARGRAYFIDEPNVARLRVTFFWPFYAGYNLIEIDHENYNFALVCGPDREYLWILARTRQLDDPIVQQLIVKAQALNFDTDKLIFVEQGD